MIECVLRVEHGTCRQPATQAALCMDPTRRVLVPPSIHSSLAGQRYLRGPAHTAAASALHVIADHRSLCPAWVRKRQACSVGTPEGGGRGARRTRRRQQAPPGGTADAVGEGRAAARDHVRTTWRRAVRGPWQGRPVGHPTARVGGGSRSRRLLPVPADL